MTELEEVIIVEVDPDTKREAELVLADINLDLSQAIGLFLNYVATEKNLPVCLLKPNNETIAALNGVPESKAYYSVDELFADLEKD